MFSKIKKGTRNTLKGPVSIAKLMAQFQENADKVEENILRCEELLAVDDNNDKEKLPMRHRDEVSDILHQTEVLFKDLALDLDKVKELKHPQAEVIESDINNMYDRWSKDYDFYKHIYEQIDLTSRHWESVFNQKEKQLITEQYGPTMEDLEKQISAHDLLHKEVASYSSQLSVSSVGSKEKYTALKKQYDNILDKSRERRHYLSSLYEYMQGCNKKLAFLREEQEKIKKQDWSDHIENPADSRRQFENFKDNSLLSHESEVNKLEDKGDRLIEMKHPASPLIQAQRDAVKNEWEKLLNLCICQETHLDNVEEYKKYQMDAEQLSETLTKLNNSLDATSLSKKSKSATLLQLEAEEKAVQNSEHLLAHLRRRSVSIAPLKLRHNAPNRPITVESLCEWEGDKDSLSRSEKFTLKSNSVSENWEVVSADGASKTFPGVCFQIPPPDPEAIDKVDLLGSELADIKKRRAALAESLKNHKSDVFRMQQSVQATSSLTSSAPNSKSKIKHFIDEHRNELIERVSNIDSLLDDLLEKEVIKQGMYDRIRAKSTTQEMMRDLYSGPLKAAKACKDILYDSLEKHEKYLMEDLKNG